MLLMALIILTVFWAKSNPDVGQKIHKAWVRFAAKLPKTIGGRLFLLIAIAALMVAFAAIARSEALALAAPALPDALAWFTLFDIGTAIDVAGLFVLAAMTGRLQALGRFAHGLSRQVAALIRRALGTRRAGRARRPRPPRSHSDDEDAAVPLGLLGLAA